MALSVGDAAIQRKRWRDGAIVSASVALHGVVLGYLGMETMQEPRRYGPPQVDHPVLVLPLDLTPVRPRRDVRPATQQNVDPASTVARGYVAAPLPPRLRLPDAPEPPPADSQPRRRVLETANGYVIEDVWRVAPAKTGPGRGRPGGLACPARPGDELAARLCPTSSAPTRAEAGEAYAEVARSRQDPSDQRREEGFDRQARANEAWRSYTRDGGAYPGLRSLFRDR